MAKTDWQMDDTVMPSDLNQIGQEINELQADGSTNDDRIGERTIDDTVAPTTNTGKLTGLLSGLASMIKSITGGATWRTAPGMSLAAIKTILDSATNAATANALIKRDANGRAKVAAPSAIDDIARKAEVDAAITTAATDATSKANAAQAAAISAAATDATTKANAVQSNLTSHANDTIKHITAAERTAWSAKANKDGTLQANLNAELWGGWKRYSSLASLGLTTTSTVDEIFAALPVNGILEYIGPGTMFPLYHFSGAMIRFTKFSSTKMNGVFYRDTTNDVSVYHSVYASEGTPKWSGWQKVAWTNGELQTNLNADLLDGYHGSYYASKDFVFDAIDSRGAFGVTTGTDYAFKLNFSVAPKAYYAGMTIALKLHTDTGPIPSLDINNRGPKHLYAYDGVSRFTGVAGRIYRFIYDGTNFVNV